METRNTLFRFVTAGNILGTINSSMALFQQFENRGPLKTMFKGAGCCGTFILVVLCQVKLLIPLSQGSMVYEPVTIIQTAALEPSRELAHVIAAGDTTNAVDQRTQKQHSRIVN